jgi:tRNA (guanine37-N1)-methyltransferase
VAEGLIYWRTFVLRASGRLVGSVRGRAEGQDWVLDRLMVAPDLQHRGLGRWLLAAALDEGPAGTARCVVRVPRGCEPAVRLCRRAGFRRLTEGEEPGTVTLSRRT